MSLTYDISDQAIKYDIETFFTKTDSQKVWQLLLSFLEVS